MSQLLFTVLLLIASFLAHVAWWRICLPKHHTNALLLNFATAPFFITLLLMRLLPTLVPTDFWSWAQIVVAYIPASLVYITLYSALEMQSPAFLLLQHVAKTGPQGAQIAEITQLFEQGDMLTSRLEQMAVSQLIKDEGDSYSLTRKGLVIGRFFAFTTAILGIPAGG